MAPNVALYRWFVIGTSALSAVASAFGIFFLVAAFCTYRAEDFRIATVTEDFESFGTCLEMITDEQLRGAGYHKPDDLDCNDGNKENLERSLLVSVHGLYYAYAKANIRSWTMRRTVETVLTAVALKTDENALKLVPLNFTTIYDALHDVSQLSLPKTCKDIYGGASYDWRYHFRSQKKDSATGHLCEDLSTEEQIQAQSTCKAGFPIDKIPIACGADQPLDSGDYNRIPTLANGMLDIDSTVLDRLYTHCEDQFRFHFSGTVLNSGTFGIPLVGQSTEPILMPWVAALGYNSSTDYNTRTKIMLGMRFGFSAWAYAPMIMASAFFLADALVFFLAEATANERIIGTAVLSAGGNFDRRKDSLVMQATTLSTRAKRLALGTVAFIASLVFYLLFAAIPWGIGETQLKRPLCETGEPDHDFNLGFTGTKGGWKADYDAQWFEILAIVFQAAVLLLLPFSTTGFFGLTDLCRGRARRAVRGGIIPRTGLVASSERSLFFQETLLPFLLVGAVIAVAGQAVSNYQFGYAWAEGVIGFAEYANIFQPKVLFDLVFNQAICTGAVVLLSGLLIGVTVARWTINGASCATSLVFVVWIVFVAAFCLPILLFSSRRSLFDRDKAYEDCAAFEPEEDFFWAVKICQARFWTFLIGGGLMLLIIVAMTLIGCLEGIPELIRGVRRSNTSLSVERQNLVDGINGEFVASGKHVGGNQIDSHTIAANAYHSKGQSFYNFSTGETGQPELSALLRAPRTQTLFAKTPMVPLPTQR